MNNMVPTPPFWFLQLVIGFQIRNKGDIERVDGVTDGERERVGSRADWLAACGWCFCGHLVPEASPCANQQAF